MNVSSHLLRGARLAPVAAVLLMAASGLASAQETDPLKTSPGQKPAEKAEAAVPADDLATVKGTLREETDIIRSLAPFADGNPNAPPRQPRDVDSDDGKVRVDYSRAIDMTVFFDYDSARLKPEARIQLEPLAKALQSKELMPHRFLIAGHTDSIGSAGYNRNLSLKRAESVRGHLINEYGIDPQRLVIHGWGEDQLKDADQPKASVNRRVEVALIMPNQQSDAGELVDDEADCCSDPRYGADHPRQRADFRAELGDGRTLVVDGDEARIERRSLGDAPFVLHAGAEPVVSARFSGCLRHRLSDPRLRLHPYALDDFGATRTTLCSRTGHINHGMRTSATYDPMHGEWHSNEFTTINDDTVAN
jgi:OmpA-OmpF porin, OOP family